MVFSSSKKGKMESLGFPHKGRLQLVVAMAVADQWFSSWPWEQRLLRNLLHWGGVTQIFGSAHPCAGTGLDTGATQLWAEPCPVCGCPHPSKLCWWHAERLHASALCAREASPPQPGLLALYRGNVWTGSISAGCTCLLHLPVWS